MSFAANSTNATGALKIEQRGLGGNEVSGGYDTAVVIFNASLVARTGDVTHGKQLGVKYIIKF